jgi:hypothetical protein
MQWTSGSLSPLEAHRFMQAAAHFVCLDYPNRTPSCDIKTNAVFTSWKSGITLIAKFPKIRQPSLARRPNRHV